MRVKALATLLVLAPVVHCHMILATPKPFHNPPPDNSPLSSSGSNYPCKVTGDPAAFFQGAAGASNTYTAGESATVSFQGSAVHGGGSCQLAITSELTPSPSTAWEVIHSIEGGCPSKDGTSPSTYDFTMPASVQPGTYVFAWTWISKLAGQPEFYMNCAPIQVKAGGAGSRKRAANDSAALDGRFVAAVDRPDVFPPLFVANLGWVNDCKVGPGVDPTFPYPGLSVERPGTGSKFTAPTGSLCFAKGFAFSADTASAPPAPPAPHATTTLPPGPPASSSADAGYFATAPETAAGDAPPPAPRPTEQTSAMGSGSSPPPPPPSSPSSSTSSSLGSAGRLTGACSKEGLFNCPDSHSYQQCAAGAWSAVRPMASGTACKMGQSATLWARDGFWRRRLRAAGRWGAQFAGREE